MMANGQQLGQIWGIFNLVLLLLVASVAFVAARASAVLSLGAFTACGLYLLYMPCFLSCSRRSLALQMVIHSQREIRRTMRRKGLLENPAALHS